ncbi:hypothetical protein BDF19DRAFT_69346 [Syncephalis fuscata]|nr:hypothetical protein BDF19DRAFT_69346 [Syncephalis fuscata]
MDIESYRENDASSFLSLSLYLPTHTFTHTHTLTHTPFYPVSLVSCQHIRNLFFYSSLTTYFVHYHRDQSFGHPLFISYARLSFSATTHTTYQHSHTNSHPHKRTFVLTSNPCTPCTYPHHHAFQI